MGKIFKIGCLSVAGLCALIFIYFLIEPESWRKAREDRDQRDVDTARYYIKRVTKQMALVRSILPYLTEETTPMSFPKDTIKWEEILQTSVDEVNHFSDSGYRVSPPPRSGPWLSESLQIIEDTYDTARPRNTNLEMDKGRFIMNKKYLVVYQPIHHLQPYMVDKKTFQPGYFDGWMIYVDFKKPKTLGYARFQSFTTLYKIENQQFGVGIGPISIPLINTANFKEELLDDFRQEFFKKSDSTYRANMTHH